MASANHVKILDVCNVTPSFDSPESATESSLPLTFFDLMWLKFPPSDRLMFFKLTEPTPNFLNSVILPRLKESLASTLIHFLPVAAGNITWPPESTKPFVLYTPNDGVSLTIAESSADFDYLSSNEIREAIDLHPYIPQLSITSSKASIMALQITLFPNQGFSIGINAHHAMLDGKSTTFFMKAWAHACKQLSAAKGKLQQRPPSSLPTELTPFLDRTVIQDPDGLEMEYLGNWIKLPVPPGFDVNPRSLELLPSDPTIRSSKVRKTVDFSPEDIKKLREKAVAQIEKVRQEDPTKTKPPTHLSTFVLACAYTMVCMMKAKGLESDRKVCFGVTVDCRSRLDPPIPDNYFGSCVNPFVLLTDAKALVKENGFGFAAEKLSENIAMANKSVLDGAKGMYEKMKTWPNSVVFSVAGSNRFQAYEADFGWGKPKKVEIIAIDRADTISMMESKNGDGGIEVGLALKKHEMEIFNSLFVAGLANPN